MIGPLLGALFLDSRQRLLLHVRRVGPVTRQGVAREFPDVPLWLVVRACSELLAAEWLQQVGVEGRNVVLEVRPGAADEAAAELAALLPGCWAAQKFGEQDLAGEVTMLRSPRQLDVAQALLNGSATTSEISRVVGVGSGAARAHLTALSGRGLAARAAGGRWSYRARPLQLWTFLVLLGAAAPTLSVLSRPGGELLASAVAVAFAAATDVLEAAEATRETERNRALLQVALGQLAGLIKEGHPDLPEGLLHDLQRALGLRTEDLAEVVVDGCRAADKLRAWRRAGGSWLGEQRGQA